MVAAERIALLSPVADQPSTLWYHASLSHVVLARLADLTKLMRSGGRLWCFWFLRQVLQSINSAVTNESIES